MLMDSRMMRNPGRLLSIYEKNWNLPIWGMWDAGVDCSQLDQNDNCHENIDTQRNLTANENFISPAQFRPHLKAQPRKNIRKSRKKGKSIIVKDTPEKDEIERERLAKKRQKKNPIKKLKE
ncbi:hypothetical protein HHI36_008908 [Cryptolaemus montrouzieri]|uniref:Uncharacterized protein n=1 Tax=Cryptolaemus montrouzieri TaxID=559131 RepID=A0ABD2MTR3_9CUCU